MGYFHGAGDVALEFVLPWDGGALVRRPRALSVYRPVA